MKHYLPRVLMLLASVASVQGLVPEANAQGVTTVVTTWNARFSTLRGDLSCKYGDPGCNRCVYDVEKQFAAITRHDVDGDIHTWSWINNKSDYKPANHSVEKVLTVTPGGSSHFQGYTRAPSGDPNFLATYAGDNAGVFMMSMNEKGNGSVGDGTLTELHDSKTNHPGGVQGIGQYFTLASYEDDQAYIEVFDSSNPLADPKRMPIGAKAAAAVAGARVAGGGYVFITDTDSKVNGYQLWYTPSFEDPHFESMWIPSVVSAKQPDLHHYDGYQAYEGLAMITECGTGQLYMVGIQGGGAFISQEGIWTLHKLSAGPSGPALEYIMRNTNDMYKAGCNTRAGGSAFAGKYGNLGLYCGQKGQDENQRIWGTLCGSNLAYQAFDTILLGGADAFGSTLSWILGIVSCTKVTLDDNEGVITEYWADYSTPESPVVPPRDEVTLSVSARGHFTTNDDGTVQYAYGETSVTVLIDETPNDKNPPTRVESCTALETRVCQYKVLRGSKVVMIASGGGPANWNDDYCAAHADTSHSDPVCTATLDQNMTVNATSYVVL